MGHRKFKAYNQDAFISASVRIHFGVSRGVHGAFVPDRTHSLVLPHLTFLSFPILN